VIGSRCHPSRCKDKSCGWRPPNRGCSASKASARSSNDSRSRWLGATYQSVDVSELGFEPDITVECTGVGEVIADCILNVAAGGIVCVTGGGDGAAAAVAIGDVASLDKGELCRTSP